MKLEKLAYSFFGNNLVIGKQTIQQLSFLENILPLELLGREMDDLGCGDGKLTVKLKEIFRPSKLRGFDVNQGLVKRAKSRGIHAEAVSLDEYVPGGELAVMWGVLHHLKNPQRCLQRLKDNYSYIFIREPIKTKPLRGLELGNPMKLEDLTGILGCHLSGHHIHYCGDNLLAFYGCNGRDENKEDMLPEPASVLVSKSSVY